MPQPSEHCSLCKRPKENDGNSHCKKCELSLFQINTIIDDYINNPNPPQWLIDGAGEIFSWSYSNNPLQTGFFNTANEIASIFAIDRIEKIPMNDLKEINYTNLPREKVLKILKNAFLIDYDQNFLYPGPIARKLIEIRWEGYEMNSPQVKQKLKEMHGIISVAITKSLLLQPRGKPRHALAIFQLVSHIMQLNGIGGPIEPNITEYDLDIAFNTLVARQQDKIKRTMTGFTDGEPKIITDKDVEGKMPLNAISLTYIEKMRERYRERERSDRVVLI